MMAEPWGHTGVVLAGGTSDRMGVAKEWLLMPDGRPMIGTVIDTLEEVCSAVVVAGGRIEGRTSVPDIRPDAGPLAGIEAVLASGLDDHYLICAGDTPHLTASLLRRLLRSKSELTVFEIAGQSRIQSLPIKISAGMAEHVSSALDSGQCAIHHLIRSWDTDYVSLSNEEGKLLRSVNTKEDYEAIRDSARGSSSD